MKTFVNIKNIMIAGIALAAAALCFIALGPAACKKTPEEAPDVADAPARGDARLRVFALTDPVAALGVIDELNVTVYVPAGTALTAMKARATAADGASVEPDPAEPHDYSAPRTFTVTAADGSRAEYTVTVDASEDAAGAAAGAPRITSFKIILPLAADGVIDHAEKTVEAVLPAGTAVDRVTALVTHTGASVEPDPSEPRDYSAPRTFTVTAADGSRAAYRARIVLLAPGETLPPKPPLPPAPKAVGIFDANGARGDAPTLAAALEWLDGNVASGGAYRFVLSEDQTLSPRALDYADPWKVKNVSIALEGAPGKEVVIRLAYRGALFTIVGCTLEVGRGVTLQGVPDNDAFGFLNVSDGGTLHIKDGAKISGNKTSRPGGAIYVNESTLIISGGEISGNESGNQGGAIYLTDMAKLKMTGGLVSANRAGFSGGAICLHYGSTADISGGGISANVSNVNGGGIALYRNSRLTFGGTAVVSNNRTRNPQDNGGGGVCLNDRSVLEFYGGTISGNSTASKVEPGATNLYRSPDATFINSSGRTLSAADGFVY